MGKSDWCCCAERLSQITKSASDHSGDRWQREAVKRPRTAGDALRQDTSGDEEDEASS